VRDWCLAVTSFPNQVSDRIHAGHKLQNYANFKECSVSTSLDTHIQVVAASWYSRVEHSRIERVC
jgi:hypothetical protein